MSLTFVCLRRTRLTIIGMVAIVTCIFVQHHRQSLYDPAAFHPDSSRRTLDDHITKNKISSFNLSSMQANTFVRYEENKSYPFSVYGTLNIDELIQEFDFFERSSPPDSLHGRDRRPSFPFISGDGFRSLCKHRCEEKGCLFSPKDVRRGDCIFIATTNLDTRGGTMKYILDFANIVDKIEENFVVITHNGDLSSPDGDDWHRNDASFYSKHHSHLLSNPKLLRWFASNCNWKDYPAAKPQKVVCIPLGIENRYNVVGKSPKDYFTTMKQRSYVVSTKRLLVSFTADAFKPARKAALVALTAPWITKKVFSDRKLWIQTVQDHVFVACPVGHGWDTHRVWEVLLAGTFPVVETTPLDSMYEHLPVLIVQKWSDVNEELLDRSRAEFMARNDFQKEKMFFAFWKNLILAN